ncbi:oligosaccharide flippase family protein [Bacteroides stercorirosoris]|nr:oligosaccharide flippase family protein [Bacteroides stercorirosoris]
MLSALFRNRNARNGVLFAMYSMLNTGINFIVMMLMAKYINPNSYGSLSLFTTLISFLTIFICLGTNGFIGVNFFVSEKDKIRRLVNVVLITSIFIFFFLLFTFIVFRGACERLMGLSFLFLFLAILYCLLHVVISLLLDIWRLEEKVGKYGILSISYVLSNLVFTLIFVGVNHLDWHGRVYAQLLTCIVFFSISIFVLKKKGYLINILPLKKDFKESYKFGIPLLPHGTSFWLRQGLDRYVINAFMLQSVVGLFSFAVNISNIIQIIGMAFNASYSVYIYKMLSSQEKTKIFCIKRNCVYLSMCYLVITIVIYVAALFLLPVVFPQYIDSRIYLFPLCIASMFQCLYLVYVNILFYYKKTKQLMYITFPLAIIHAVLSVIFTKYGAVYAAYIALFVNALIALTVYLYSQKILNNNVALEAIDK